MHKFNITRVLYEDKEDNVDIVSTECPKCDRENSLIVMQSQQTGTFTNMRISCMCCKFKFTGVFKK